LEYRIDWKSHVFNEIGNVRVVLDWLRAPELGESPAAKRDAKTPHPSQYYYCWIFTEQQSNCR
jgi:hypothetical protein